MNIYQFLDIAGRYTNLQGVCTPATDRVWPGYAISAIFVVSSLDMQCGRYVIIPLISRDHHHKLAGKPVFRSAMAEIKLENPNFL